MAFEATSVNELRHASGSYPLALARPVTAKSQVNRVILNKNVTFCYYVMFLTVNKTKSRDGYNEQNRLKMTDIDPRLSKNKKNNRFQEWENPYEWVNPSILNIKS